MLCVPVYSFYRWNFTCRRNFRSHKGFPCGSAGKESACNVGDPHWIPGLGRCSGEGDGYPLQYSGLENSMNYTVHGVAKSQTQLSDFHFQVVAEQSEQKCPPYHLILFNNLILRAYFKALSTYRDIKHVCLSYKGVSENSSCGWRVKDMCTYRVSLEPINHRVPDK